MPQRQRRDLEVGERRPQPVVAQAGPAGRHRPRPRRRRACTPPGSVARSVISRASGASSYAACSRCNQARAAVVDGDRVECRGRRGRCGRRGGGRWRARRSSISSSRQVLAPLGQARPRPRDRGATSAAPVPNRATTCGRATRRPRRSSHRPIERGAARSPPRRTRAARPGPRCGCGRGRTAGRRASRSRSPSLRTSTARSTPGPVGPVGVA